MSQSTISGAVDTVLRFRDASGNPLVHRMNGRDYALDPDKTLVVLMMGPKRCGKTSVLTSINRCIKNTCANTALNFSVRNDNSGNKRFFLEKEEELMKFADNPVNFRESSVGNPGITATDSIRNYDFVTYHKKNPKNIYMIRFIDANGEYYRDYPEQMNRLVDRSDMIIIAVDTPSIMSDDDYISKTVNGFHFINDYFDELDISVERPRLLLFTPLKCEKYFRTDKHLQEDKFMNEVRDNVKRFYSQAIQRITENYSNMFAIAVTPVMTVGGVKFLSYEMDQNGNYKKNANNEPYANYIKDTANKGYNPEHCEQLFFYLLTFISNILDGLGEVDINDSLWDKLKKLFGTLPVFKKMLTENDPFLKNEMKRLSRNIIINRLGYEIISDKRHYLGR